VHWNSFGQAPSHGLDLDEARPKWEIERRSKR
jgi:hypothetical protein